jgi:hypothetical protein
MSPASSDSGLRWRRWVTRGVAGVSARSFSASALGQGSGDDLGSRAAGLQRAKRVSCVAAVALGALVLFVGAPVRAYPTDAFERTQIRRLKWQHDIDTGARRGLKLPPGAHWGSERISLTMLNTADYRVTAETPKDPALQAGLEAILKKPLFHHFNVALLDISDPKNPRFAAVRETEAQIPGSVAKLLIGAAVFYALRQRFPHDIAEREAFLRDVKVTADDWALPNSHEVPVIDGDRVWIRPVRAGDTFSLWEWLDHMLSPSSNAAASMVWREATLMRLLGTDYPPKSYGAELFSRFDRKTLSEAAFAAVDAPLIEAGIDPETFKLRLFFTRGAGKHIDSGTTSVTPLALLQWMLAVEQGRMVDAFSSLELKRLLYLTRRRVRYAKAAELKDSALFFKSGSYFHCVPEPGYTCVQYEGNAINVLNTLVEVDTEPAAELVPAAKEATTAPEAASVGTPSGPEATAGKDAVAQTAAAENTAAKDTAPHDPGAPDRASKASARAPDEAAPRARRYIVAVMSNELRRNAAEDHAKLASYLHDLLQRM